MQNLYCRSNPIFSCAVPDKQLIWYLFCVLLVLGQVAQGVLTSITDSLVLKAAELEGSDFGRIRMFGSIGYGFLALFISWLNNLDTKFLPRYVPGLLFFVLLQLVDCVLVLVNLKKIRMKDAPKPVEYQSPIKTISQYFVVQEQQSTKEERSSDELVEDKPKKQMCKLVLRTFYHHPMLAKYVLVCVVVGMMTGLNWNFFPMYLESELANGDSSLIGYVALVQCFAGEIPFLFFASRIVDRIGVQGSLSLVLLAFGCRYLVYSFFTPATAIYILFVETLQGLTFGLFYYVMNRLAHDYSKKMAKVELDYRIKEAREQSEPKAIAQFAEDDSAFATMQGVLSGAFEGFGAGLGSLLSGVLIQHFGWNFLWYLSSGTSFVVFFIDFVLIAIIALKNRFTSKT